KYLHGMAYAGLAASARPEVASVARNAPHACNRYRALLREGIASRREKRLTQPVLMICGNRDPFVLPPTLDEVEAYADSPEIRILEAGHWPFLEKPLVVQSILEKFLFHRARCGQTDQP